MMASQDAEPDAAEPDAAERENNFVMYVLYIDAMHNAIDLGFVKVSLELAIKVKFLSAILLLT